MTKQKKATAKFTDATKAKGRAKTKSGSTTKLAQLEALLRRPDCATIAQLSRALDWQTHSVRGAMSGTLKKRGVTITSEKKEEGDRIYRIAA
ncbi:MAG: DUF3489 domain-containing protein [Alphaproteobacteria bacterium]|jgi:hypothetical protein|nr:DUF3489 domain-containing protein [Alphaproteobacteria bacterium]